MRARVVGDGLEFELPVGHDDDGAHDPPGRLAYLGWDDPAKALVELEGLESDMREDADLDLQVAVREALRSGVCGDCPWLDQGDLDAAHTCSQMCPASGVDE